MKVPGTEGDTAFHRGHKTGMLVAVGSLMAIVYAELGADAYEQIKGEVLDWAEAHTGFRPPSVEELEQPDYAAGGIGDYSP